MTSPSDSVRKCNRANTQFEDLSREVAKFIVSRPYFVRIEKKPEPGQWRILARCESCPIDWGLMVGEIANNTRSALDYIVSRASNEPSSSPKRKALGFPICHNCGEFHDKRVSSRLRGIDSNMVSLIESFQPYKGGGVDDPLNLLNKINNSDKHHAIQTTVAVAANGGLSISGRIGTNYFGGVGVRISNSTNISFGDGVVFNNVRGGIISEHETEIADFTTNARSQIDMEPHITPDVQFGRGIVEIEGRPVIPTLRVILDRVKEIIGHFP